MDINAINHMLRHSLKSESDIPMTERSLFQEIYRDCCKSYEPVGDAEIALVRELAFASWKMNLGDRLYFERIDYERSIAPDVFKARDEATFKKNFRQYLKDSEIAYNAICGTVAGREYFINFLNETLVMIEHGDTTGKFNAARIGELIRATGQSTRVQNVTSEPGRLLICALSFAKGSANSIAELLAKIFRNRPVYSHEIEQIESRLITTDQARTYLVEWLRLKIENHANQLAILRQRADEQIQFMAETQAGFGMGDSQLYKAASILCTFLEDASDQQLRILTKLNDSYERRQQLALRQRQSFIDSSGHIAPNHQSGGPGPRLYRPDPTQTEGTHLARQNQKSY